MKITGEALCPTCNKEHPVSIDIDKLEVKNPQPPALNNPFAQTTTQLEKPEIKEVEKIVKKILPSADQPYYECKNCGASCEWSCFDESDGNVPGE